MNRDKTILQIIIREIDILLGIVSSIDRPAFLASQIDKRAVVMTLINIGEKVKDLTVEFKQSHAEIPWKQISGIRDMAVHAYLQLNFERVWETITDDIPTFKSQLIAILN